MLSKPKDAIGLIINVLDKQEAGSYDQAVYTRLTEGVADSQTKFWIYLAVGGIAELVRYYLNFDAATSTSDSDASTVGMYVFIEIVVMAVLG